MNLNQQQLEEAIKIYKYHSFHYVDDSVLKDYTVICHQSDVLLIKGIHPSQQKPHIHFFVNDMDSLIASLKPYSNHLIEFVPIDWMSPLEKAGYIPYGVFRDYWYTYSNPLELIEPLSVATEKDIEAIALLSQSRMGSSRAFSGESIEVTTDWVTNHVDSVDDACILIHKHEVIDGALMVGLYGSADKRTLWVRMIVVNASSQNQGIGRKLLSQALYYGQQKGAKRAFLMADDLNQNALHLYQKMGFKPDLTSEQINMITK